MRHAKPPEPASGVSAYRQSIAQPGMAEREIRVELDRLGQVHQRGLRMPPTRMREAEHQMSPRILIVELDGARSGVEGALGEFVDRPAGVEGEQRFVSPTEHRVGVGLL